MELPSVKLMNEADINHFEIEALKTLNDDCELSSKDDDEFVVLDSVKVTHQKFSIGGSKLVVTFSLDGTVPKHRKIRKSETDEYQEKVVTCFETRYQYFTQNINAATGFFGGVKEPNVTKQSKGFPAMTVGIIGGCSFLALAAFLGVHMAMRKGKRHGDVDSVGRERNEARSRVSVHGTNSDSKKHRRKVSTGSDGASSVFVCKPDHKVNYRGDDVERQSQNHQNSNASVGIRNASVESIGNRQPRSRLAVEYADSISSDDGDKFLTRASMQSLSPLARKYSYGDDHTLEEEIDDEEEIDRRNVRRYADSPLTTGSVGHAPNVPTSNKHVSLWHLLID